MNKIKKYKNILIITGFALLILLVIIILKSKQEKEYETAPIPTDRTELIDETELEETAPNPLLAKLPYDGWIFYIDYPELDIYNVYIKSPDIEKAKQSAYEWFISQGADLEKLKIRFITESDEELTEKLIKKLPVEEPEFRIWVSAKTNSFVVTVKGDSFEQGKNKAINWFREQGLRDLTKINLIWQDQTND